MSEPMLIQIDGSVMEGGGQILRISISLSAILGIPVRITKIRAGRSKPGLAMQHLKGIQLVGQMCGADIKGASLGSTEVEFRPRKLRGGNYEADAVTAGSISLLLQVALPCALLADGPVTMDLKGGTNVDMAPQIEYMDTVFLHMLKKFGGDFMLNMMKRGLFPRGGGFVRVMTRPVRAFNNVEITERGAFTTLKGYSFVSGSLPMFVAHEMSNAARYELLSEGSLIIEKHKADLNSPRYNGNGITLTCLTSTGCMLGADGLAKLHRAGGDVVRSHMNNAECIGRTAGEVLKAELKSGACVDTHAQDQIIIYMALAEGKSVVRVGEVTLHTKTAIHIAELIAKTKFEIRPDGNTNLIECTGLGVTSVTPT